MSVVENPDGLQLVHGDADAIGPEEGDGEDGEQSFYPPDVGEVGVLDVEPAGLQGLEARLNLPTHFISVDGFLWLVERQEDLEFGLAFAVLHPCGGEVAVLPVDEVDAPQVLGLAHLELLERPEGLEGLAVVRVVHPEVLADAYVVAYAVVIEPSYPMPADELAVGHEAVDGGLAEELDVSLHQLYPLPGVGVALLRQEPEQQREGDTLIGDGQDEGVDVERPELPVGAVHREHIRPLAREEPEDEPGDQREVEVVARHEALDAPHARRGGGLPAEGRGEPHEVDGAQRDERDYHLRHELEARQIDCFSEMGVQDVE